MTPMHDDKMIDFVLTNFDFCCKSIIKVFINFPKPLVDSKSLYLL